MSEILVDAAALEEWICQQDQKEIVRWINRNNQEKIQKYLSYAWNHPSERIKLHMENLLDDKINNPINTLCKKGDPSNGELLRVFLNFMESIDQDYFEDQQPFLILAATYEKLTTEQLRMILTHPKTTSPFYEKGCPYKMTQPESAIEIGIKNNNLDYFKEMIKHDPQMDKALSLACRLSLKILQYLIEEEGLSVNEIVCGKTPLQHSLNSYDKKKATADYLISRGADVTKKDEQGNLAFFYGCIYGYDNLDRLIVPSIDIWAKTKGIRVGYSDITDGMGLFGVATQFHRYESLRHLLELKSALSQDPKLDRFVVADVMLHGDYIALWMLWHYIKTRDVIDFLTQRTYGWDHTTPIEKLFREYSEIQANGNRHQSRSPFSTQREANVRAIWKHLLMKLSREEIETLLNTEIPNEGAIRHFIDSQYLLPDEYQLSYNLWRSELEYNLGMLSNLPREIVSSIFSYLTASDACKIISVSKSWFKEITAKQIWISHPKADPNSSNPFRSIQKFQTDYYTDTRKSGECFRQIVRIDDGEGLLVLESGFLTGLKLNGEPIISSWADSERSVHRCMVRSRSLSQESIETAIHHIETMLNTGRIDFSSLVDTLMPFMKCLPSGFYDVKVFVRGSYRLFEYQSDSDLSEIHEGNISYPLVYLTQPSDLLNEERIKFYEDQIRNGLRPAALAITVYEEQIIIDGHHKILAYKNLGLLNELVIVGISYNRAEISYHQITTEDEEMKYISHSKTVQDKYNEAKMAAMSPDEMIIGHINNEY